MRWIIFFIFVLGISQIATAEIIKQADNHIQSVSWSGDSTTFATLSTNGTVRIYNQNGTELNLINSTTGRAIALNDDGSRIAIATTDGEVYIWNTLISGGRTPLTEIRPITTVFALIWASNDSGLITVAFEGNPNLQIWDSVTGAFVSGHNVGTTYAMDWVSSEDHLALGNVAGVVQLLAYDNFAILDDVVFLHPETTGTDSTLWNQYSHSAIAWSPDGQLIATGTRNGSVRIWNANLQTIIHNLSGNEGIFSSFDDENTSSIRALSFSSDGTKLRSISTDGTYRGWDTSSGVMLFSVQIGSPIYSAEFDPTGQRYIYGTDDDEIVLGSSEAQTPSISPSLTTEGYQTTGGLEITPSPANGPEVTRFKITGITNGTLYQNDGVTAISDGEFITVAQGEAGLRFTPSAGFIGEAGFEVQASLSVDDSGLGGDVVRATITVNPVTDASKDLLRLGQICFSTEYIE